jgi:hypothetical protein
MSQSLDRLYDLLPAFHRMKDADQGFPLRALLQVISEQINVVEDDIAQLYENWFIETCDDWVVPYFGDLIGYQPVHEAGDPGDISRAEGVQRNKILISRSELANTIGFRRRKGTLALLDQLAITAAGWPGQAVEFYRLLAATQNIDYLHLHRGQTANLRKGDALDRLDGPFDTIARAVDVRRIDSSHTQGRHNIPGVGVFVCRLKPYSITNAPAYCHEDVGPQCYEFSALGNDSRLFVHPQPVAKQTAIPSELNLPLPIRPRRLAKHGSDYCGDGKSFMIWTGKKRKPVSLDQITVADLTDWAYRAPRDRVLVDPKLGRMVFPLRQLPKDGVWVSYYYGFSADMGGGEYSRTLSQPADATVYRVGETETFTRINAALTKWQQDKQGNDKHQNAVIEITDSGVYVEPIVISLDENQSLQLRAANRKRPVIRLLDWQTAMPDSLSVTGKAHSWFTLDGVVVTGRGVEIIGEIAGVTIRHSTLVPGWGLECNCDPCQPSETSLELIDAPECLTVEHSIVGSIQVARNETASDPCTIRIRDSIVDATSVTRDAISAPEHSLAYVTLHIERSTIFGHVLCHIIGLASNSIFMGMIKVARRQQGCVRFCYVPPGSRTPRRYNCQPDLADQSIRDFAAEKNLPDGDVLAIRERERLRVEPEFNSIRYGTATYCQLSETCTSEITRGADDEAEMGVFHDLFQPQRAANLRARLDQFTPAGVDAGIIFVS